MKRTRVLGLALAAVFALAAIAAAGASAAQPIWYTCAKAPKNEAKQYTGHYAGKECKKAEFVATGGKYELAPGIGKGKAFKISGSTVELHTIQPATKTDIPIICGSYKGEGLDGVPNVVSKVKLVLSHCKLLNAPCKNSSKKETIETKALSGTLGWISEPGKVAGTKLASEAEPNGPMIEVACEAIGELRVIGSVIGEDQGDVEAISKTPTISYVPGHYLGEVVWDEKGDKYSPLVNVPEFEGGTVGIIRTEIKGSITGHPEEFYPEHGVPSGLEATVAEKGEALGIYPEGAE